MVAQPRLVGTIQYCTPCSDILQSPSQSLFIPTPPPGPWRHRTSSLDCRLGLPGRKSRSRGCGTAGGALRGSRLKLAAPKLGKDKKVGNVG